MTTPVLGTRCTIGNKTKAPYLGTVVTKTWIQSQLERTLTV